VARAALEWAPSVDSLRALYRGYWTTLPLAFGGDTAGWWARDPGRLAARLRARRSAALPALFVDVGREDGLIGQNRAFRLVLADLGVPVAYAEWPGAHTWSYWRAHVGESLAWLLARVAPDAPRAARVTPPRRAASRGRGAGRSAPARASRSAEGTP
jgi:S-formylglutathione hydrolase FrmB